MAELPVNGRAWVDLVMLAPGARVNHVTSDAPSDSGLLGPSSARKGGDFELNVDGQQITVLITGTNQSAQPRFSRDIIAEFEFLSSRFDATQGRSSGLQVNAVTKSGSNVYAGMLSGYFRDDRFNAADPVAGRVLDYQDSQFSTHVRRPDPARQAALLRQLRIRERAADLPLQHAVSELQHGSQLRTTPKRKPPSSSTRSSPRARG